MIWNMYLQNMKERLFQSKRGSEKNRGISGRGCGAPGRALVFVLLISMVLCGCADSGDAGGQQKETEDAGKLRVVTTIFPQYDFVRQIAGENLGLQMLLKPGEETHSYEPTPQDIIAIQKADLFIYVGGENDSWVEDILDSPEMKNVNTLRLVDCVDTLEEEHVEGMQEERGGHEHSEDAHETHEAEELHDAHETHEMEKLHDAQETGELHDAYEAHEAEDSHEGHVHTADEHVWTSPKNAVKIVEQIAEELCRLDEVHALEYEQNADHYIEELQDLDSQFRQVAELAEHDTLLFGDRFPFRYFAQEYGLSYYAAFSGCASDTEPSAATMAFLINKAKEEQIPVILKMELSNKNIASAIAEATGTEVREFYSCHNLTAEQFAAGETYLSMMQKNVLTLKEALGEWH